MTASPYGTDQLIDAVMACSLRADACRDHAIVAWVVTRDLPAWPDDWPFGFSASWMASRMAVRLFDFVPIRGRRIRGPDTKVLSVSGSCERMVNIRRPTTRTAPATA
jgi:hypothetical protein